MKTFTISLILCAIALTGYGQSGPKNKNKAKLISNSYDSNGKSFAVVVEDFVTYDALAPLSDETISQKYTNVPGIGVFGLIRTNRGRISAKIGEENATFLLDQYLNLDDVDIKKILDSKN